MADTQRSIGALLASLQKVKQTGEGRWKACCPAHDDHTPSLAVRQMDDGRILIHCFAGCSVVDILAAVNIEIYNLFPDETRPRGDRYDAVKMPVAPQDILSLIAQEAMIVSICASDMANGKSLTDVDRVRLKTAAERINRAIAFGKW